MYVCVSTYTVSTSRKKTNIAAVSGRIFAVSNNHLLASHYPIIKEIWGSAVGGSIGINLHRLFRHDRCDPTARQSGRRSGHISPRK